MWKLPFDAQGGERASCRSPPASTRRSARSGRGKPPARPRIPARRFLGAAPYARAHSCIKISGQRRTTHRWRPCSQHSGALATSPSNAVPLNFAAVETVPRQQHKGIAGSFASLRQGREATGPCWKYTTTTCAIFSATVELPCIKPFCWQRFAHPA